VLRPRYRECGLPRYKLTMPDSASALAANDRMHRDTVAQELPATSGRKSRFHPRAFGLLTEVYFSAAASVAQWFERL
jgi:hypothetical protein